MIRNSIGGVTLYSLLIVASTGICGAQRGSAGYSPQLNMGQRALRAKRWNSAASHFRQALQWDKRGAEALSGLGFVYLGTAEPKRAVESFRAALKINPHLAEAERGVHLANSPEEEQAAFDALAEQAKNEPKNADVHATYAEELVERNRLDEGKAEAELALKLNPKEGHAYCALGRIAVKQGKDEEARAALLKAIQRDPNDDDAYAALGDDALKTKNYALASRYYRRVVAIIPDETEGHNKLIAALTAAGDAKGAEREKQALARITAKSAAQK